MTKIAIIGPKFFGYLERVVQKMIERGFDTSFIDELPSNAVLDKVFLRLAPNWLGESRTKNYYALLEKRLLGERFTHILLVSVELFPANLIKKLRENGVHVSRYAWDSNANKPHGRALDPFVKAAGSFDPEDCEAFGYRYIPLFSAIKHQKDCGKRTVDFFYSTTFKSDRPSWVKRILKACNKRGWTHQMMLFFHSRPLWLLRYIPMPHLLPMTSHFQTVPFTLDEISQATGQAKVVIDIHHRKQSGLTMRTFEAISMGATVLTTNRKGMKALPDGLQERMVFLNPDNIEDAMEEALSRTAGPLSEDQRHYLSIDRFVDEQLSLMQLDSDASKTNLPNRNETNPCRIGEL